MKRSLTALLGLVTATGAMGLVAAHSASATTDLAPLLTAAQGRAMGAGNEYIVMMKDGWKAPLGTPRSDAERTQLQTARDQHSRALVLSAEAGADAARASGASVDAVYRGLGGYLARFTPTQLEQVRRDPNVDYVKQNGQLNIQLGVDNSADVAQAAAMAARLDSRGAQPNAPWHLDRIDQRVPVTKGDQTYTYASTGKGVNVYVVDSGIKSTHTEFTGRVGEGFNGVKDGQKDDCFGHGTHVSGLIGGTTYGVAKGATLIASRYLSCAGQGNDASITSALDFVSEKAVLPAVMNASWGLKDPTNEKGDLDKLVQKVIDKGVIVVVASGNDTIDACGVTPARMKGLITVGNSDIQDARFRSSNFGPCVDLVAPGTKVTSAWHNANDATKVQTGTSMAAPVVSGAVARYLETHPKATAAEVEAWLIGHATTGLLQDAGAGSFDRILYMAPDDQANPPQVPGGPAPSPAPTSAPTAQPTATKPPLPTGMPTGMPTGTRPPMPTGQPTMPGQPSRPPRPTFPGMPGQPGKP